MYSENGIYDIAHARAKLIAKVNAVVTAI